MAKGLAIITGASSGIGYELAKLAAAKNYDLIICADETEIELAAGKLGVFGGSVETIVADLATFDGVNALVAAVGDRQIELLIANAGRGLGRAFLDQDTAAWGRVVNTNVNGTVYLVQKIAPRMVARGKGRILLTGSIAGFMPGTFQAVYNGTKAFINSFAAALANELKDTGVTVTCLMPGATETRFFERADMLDTKVGTDEKDNAADVAQAGFDAMMNGELDVVSGWRNKVQSAVANVTPSSMLAAQHRKMAEPGTAKKS